jgi:hypothetical protein
VSASLVLARRNPNQWGVTPGSRLSGRRTTERGTPSRARRAGHAEQGMPSRACRAGHAEQGTPSGARRARHAERGTPSKARRAGHAEQGSLGGNAERGRGTNDCRGSMGAPDRERLTARGRSQRLMLGPGAAAARHTRDIVTRLPRRLFRLSPGTAERVVRSRPGLRISILRSSRHLDTPVKGCELLRSIEREIRPGGRRARGGRRGRAGRRRTGSGRPRACHRRGARRGRWPRPGRTPRRGAGRRRSRCR